MKPFLGSHRYELLNHLGSGTFGEVYEVFDRERGTSVALKRPHETSADSLYYFKREFRALADVTHPNLVGLYELVGEENRWFFTMELVRGLPFTRVLRQQCLAAQYELARELLRQLTDGLLALHRSGKLHRDIKPTNVLVTESRRVVILDFGLCVDFSEDWPMKRIVGTPTYMAPEQVDGDRATRASDWYGVGVMLYESLTGRYPFGGSSVRELTEAKQCQDPRPPSDWIEDIPLDLEEICLGLLQREPSLRMGGEALLDRLGQGHSPPFPASPPFIGRSAELRALWDAFREARAGHCLLLRLHGGSGAGKTQLLRHFAEEVRRSEPKAVILEGRCYAQESVPFKALDPLIDELSRQLLRLPAGQAETLVSRNTQALMRLFPILGRVEALRLAPHGPSGMGDAKSILRRASLALRELLGRLSERYPILFVIDDLQWGDRDSIHLLRDLLSPPDPPALLLVVCYRTEEAGTAPALRELLSSATGAQELEIPLRELPAFDAEALAQALLGAEAPALAARIARDSAGNPFYIGELVHQVRTRSLDSDLPETVDLLACILQRVHFLPEQFRRVAEVLAIAGHPLSWTMVNVTLKEPQDLAPPPSLFKAGRLLRVRDAVVLTLEIYHDFVRRAVLSTMGSLQRRTLHAQLAEALEASGCADPETVAQHYLLADDIEKAAEWTTLAADRAAAAMAFKNAAELYRRSIILRGPSDPLVPVLLLSLAQTLSTAGLGQEAAETYLQLASSITNVERLALQRRAAEEFFHCGQIDRGLATLRPLLATTGMNPPTTKLGAKLANAFYGALLRLRGHGFTERPEAVIATAELERLDTIWAAVQGLGSGALMVGMDLQVRHLLLALRVGEPSRIIRALAHQTYLEAIHDGDQRRGRTQFYDSLSLRLAERHGDPKLLGYAHMTSGTAAFLQGRFQDAEKALVQAKAIYTEQCVGVAAELHQVNRSLLHTQTLLGRMEEVNRTLPVLLQDAQDRGDILAEANFLTSFSVVTHLMRDDVEKARAMLARAREICSSENLHAQRWQLIYLGGSVELYAGNPEEPWNALARHRRELTQSRMLNVQYIRLSWCEHVARISFGYARTCPSGSTEWKHAMETAKAAIKALRPFRSDLYRSTYAKLRAIDAEAVGNREEALKWLCLAEVHYRKLFLPLHTHFTMWSRGTLMGSAGIPLVNQAETWMTSIGIVHPERYVNCHIPCTGFGQSRR